MSVAAIYSTKAAAVETRRIIARLEASRRKGTKQGAGTKVTVPATWDGSGACPLGWTAHDVRSFTKDSSNWAVEITSAVVTDSADSAHRARCTAGELVVLDAAVAARVTLDGTWASAGPIDNALLRVFSLIECGQSNMVGMSNGTNQPSLLAVLSPGSLVVIGVWCIGGTPITDAIRGAFGDEHNYGTPLSGQVAIAEAVPLTVPIHGVVNQGEFESSGNTSPGPLGTVDYTNWDTGGFAQVAADIAAQCNAGRQFIWHIFLLNQSQPDMGHNAALRAKQVSAAAAYTDTNGGYGITFNLDSVPPDSPPHWNDAHYQQMNQVLGAQCIANQTQ